LIVSYESSITWRTPTLETLPGWFGEIIIVGEKAMMMRLTVHPNIPNHPIATHTSGWAQ